MTEARVHVQHMHIAFLAPLSMLVCVTFLLKNIEDKNTIGFKIQRFVLNPWDYHCQIKRDSDSNSVKFHCLYRKGFAQNLQVAIWKELNAGNIFHPVAARILASSNMVCTRGVCTFVAAHVLTQIQILYSSPLQNESRVLSFQSLFLYLHTLLLFFPLTYFSSPAERIRALPHLVDCGVLKLR